MMEEHSSSSRKRRISALIGSAVLWRPKTMIRDPLTLFPRENQCFVHGKKMQGQLFLSTASSDVSESNAHSPPSAWCWYPKCFISPAERNNAAVSTKKALRRMIDKVAAGARSPLGVTLNRGRSLKRSAMLLFLLVSVILFLVTVACVHARGRDPPQRRAAHFAALHPINETLFSRRHERMSVLLQHEDVVERLNRTALQGRACIPRNGSDEVCELLPLSSDALPAWTLRQINNCEECTDTYTYSAAVKGVRLQQRHAVFATPAAPLGRVGPMLLAMASVTDDVDVRTELRHWGWLRYVYGAGFPTVDGHAEASAHRAAPYLAVLGIPSTDQPARVALREAQRQTWLTYQEVARAENNFDAPLLPLYVFAATEPMTSVPASSSRLMHSASGARDGEQSGALTHPQINTSDLLPNLDEYVAVSRALATQTAAAEVDRRRVALHREWLLRDPADSPCHQVVSTTTTDGTREGTAASVLEYLAQALSLPVTPAFTSPAELICHASSALWQEALTHRNVLWIDMMTDRRPTTNKRLGEDGKWGLPVEVGMSQKLILWLEYAYHAFPTVPFIIKGDDDAYVKVPQFLSDVRYVMGGTRVRPPPPPPPPPHLSLRYWGNVGREGVLVPAPAMGGDTAVETYMPQYADDTKCLYWGSGRRMGSVRFNAGMLFLLHRRLVQVILEPPQDSSDDDFASLAVQEFTAEVKRRYMQADFQHEDVMIGAALRRRYRRAQQLCHGGSVWYVKEGFNRFHDLHRGKIRPITWSTVVAHRCQPADAYFLHHYFQNEYATSTVALEHGEREEDREEKAIEAAREWVAQQLNNSSGNLSGWENLPLVEWTHSVSVAPAYVVVAGDGVAVYESKYEYWNDNATSVFHGYKSRSFDGRQGPPGQYRARRRGDGTTA